MGLCLERKTNIISTILLTTQRVGIVFLLIFFAAYLGGMLMNPSTTVLHSNIEFRILLGVFGIVLLVLIGITVRVANWSRN